MEYEQQNGPVSGHGKVGDWLRDVQAAYESDGSQQPNTAWSRYPTPPAAPRKDQYISESESIDNYKQPQRRPPAKIFRDGRLMFHKTYEGPVPIGYVDTGLYEGGSNDWYEAYNEADVLWARRLSLVLRRHNIPRRAAGPS